MADRRKRKNRSRRRGSRGGNGGHARQCQACHRGRIEAHGRGHDGRPQYRCSNCEQTHTNGYAGYDWDPRHKDDPPAEAPD